MVFHAPKPIKLGSKGSSTMLWSKNVKKYPKNKNILKKTKKFKNSAFTFSPHKYLDLDLGASNHLAIIVNYHECGRILYIRVVFTSSPHKYLALDLGATNHLAITAIIVNYHEYRTFFYSMVFHAPKPIKLGSKGSSTMLWSKNVKKYPKNKNILIKTKKFKKFKNSAKLSAVALAMARCLKFYISTNFGPANKIIFEKILHFFRKIQTSKTAIKSELRRSGTEISPKTRFRIILLSNRREMYHMGVKVCKSVCALCPLYCPDRGDILGRECIHSCRFLCPCGTSLGDSTIEGKLKIIAQNSKENDCKHRELKLTPHTHTGSTT
jgi:hypothetical protein